MTRRGNSSEVVIRTIDLTKAFKGRVVVSKVSLVLRAGEIYGFLGPNGAGKTTTIRMILGLVQPTSGAVEVFGLNMERNGPQLRRRLGVVGEQPFLYDDMTALEYLAFFARLYDVRHGLARAAALLERMDLAPFGHVLARDLSRGMQTKLALARALLHDPEVLILDEPISGLDPYGIMQVRKLLEERRRAGAAILVSSHILSEIERTADRVGMIHRGQLLIEDTLDAVISKLTPVAELRIELQVAVPGLLDILRQLSGVQEVHLEGKQVLVRAPGGIDVRASVFGAIKAAGGVVIDMQSGRASLEEAFVRLTEDSLKQMGLAVEPEKERVP